MALFSKDPTPPKPQARVDSGPLGAAGGTTFIGPNVTVEGTLSGGEPIRIEGTVRGQIKVTGDLLLGTKGRIEASVHGRNVIVEGTVNGDISADDRVELVASATVDGNIKAPKIIVAEGAKFRGSVDMGSRRPADVPAATDVKPK